MTARRLRGSRLVGLLVAAAAVAFAILVFIPFSLPWNQRLHFQLQAGAYGELVHVTANQGKRSTTGRLPLRSIF